jgi:hypothetical protein
MPNSTLTGTRVDAGGGLYQYTFTLTNADPAADNAWWFAAPTDVEPELPAVQVPNSDWTDSFYYDTGDPGMAFSSWSQTYFSGGGGQEWTVGPTGAQTTGIWSFKTTELRDVWTPWVFDTGDDYTIFDVNTAPGLPAVALLGVPPALGWLLRRSRRK